MVNMQDIDYENRVEFWTGVTVGVGSTLATIATFVWVFIIK